MEEYEMHGPEEQKWLYRMALDELIEQDNRIAQINRDRDGFAMQRDVYFAGMKMRENDVADARERIAELEKSLWLAAGFLMTTNASFRGLSPKDVLAKLARMLANLKKEEEAATAERVEKDKAALSTEIALYNDSAVAVPHEILSTWVGDADRLERERDEAKKALVQVASGLPTLTSSSTDNQLAAIAKLKGGA